MRNFYYVYVLRREKDGLFYIGSTRDLTERVKLHNTGAVNSTKPRRPLELIFYEAYPNEYDAKRREGYLKTAKGKSALRVMLAEFLKSPPRGISRSTRRPAPALPHCESEF